MKKIFITFSLLAVILSCSQGSQDIYKLAAVTDGPVIVEVNGTKIHQGLLDILGKMNPRIKSQLDNPLSRKKILNSLIDQQLLYQAALKKGLDKSEDVLVKTLLNKHVIISNALIDQELEKAMKKAYEEKKADQFTKLKVSIMSAAFTPDPKKGQTKEKPTAEQKKAALAKIQKMKGLLDKGDSFEKVAKENSDDKMTNKKGGDAGQISKDDRRFARLGLTKLVDAAFKLKKDQFSDPIETKNGYYLIKVTSDPIVVSFDDAQRVLRFELQNKIKKQMLDALRKDAKIEYAVKGPTTKSPDPKPKVSK